VSGGGSSLRLLNVTESDAGVLQCNASNLHGYIFANVYLTVHGRCYPMPLVTFAHTAQRHSSCAVRFSNWQTRRVDEVCRFSIVDFFYFCYLKIFQFFVYDQFLKPVMAEAWISTVWGRRLNLLVCITLLSIFNGSSCHHHHHQGQSDTVVNGRNFSQFSVIGLHRCLQFTVQLD